MTRAEQIGHWVEGLVADPDPSSENAVQHNLEESECGASRVREVLHLPLDWNLPRPEIIFSITGSAQNGEFDLGDTKGLQNWFKNRLHEFRARVIFGVAITKTGWIIDGGSNQGIMKALGNTRQHLMYPPLAPLIGMSSLNLKPPEGIETKHKPDSECNPETQSPLSNATAPPSTEGKMSHAATAAAKAGHSFARSKRFLDPREDHLDLSKRNVKYLGWEAILLDRRAQFVCTIAHLKFVRDIKVGLLTLCNWVSKLFGWRWRVSFFSILLCVCVHRITNYDLRPLFPYATIALLFLCAIAKYGTKSFVSLIILCNRVLKLFGWPQRVSLFLIFFFVFFHCITNYMLWSLFSPPNGHTITLQSVVAAYGSTDVDITSQIIWAPFGFYFDTRSSVQIVRYFLSAYIVLFAWRLLSFLTLWPTCKPVFHALQMTIVNKNVIIFVGFIVIFSIVFAMSGLIAFGREDEEHYGTPWGSWMTTFLYLTGEDQARDIINKPLNVFSSYLDLSLLFPFGECPTHPLRFHRAPRTATRFVFNPQTLCC